MAGDVGQVISRTAALTGSGAMSASNKMSLSFTFSGSTKPAGIIDSGQNGTVTVGVTTVSGGIITEGDTGTGNVGPYWSVALWPDPTVTNVQDVKVTVGSNTTHTGAGEGAACAFDSTGTNGVIAVIDNGTFGGQIMTKVGTTWTQRAVNSSLRESTAGDVLEIIMSVSAGIFTYTLFKNGATTGLSWTDSTGIITPGRYWGGAFQHHRPSGVPNPSKGLTNFTGADI
jgi:hypothetical protein